MSTTLIFHWVLWGASLLAGAAAIRALFKLRLAERSLPAWNEVKEINAQLPLLREEHQRAGEALAKLKTEVTPLRQLHEWPGANPDAPARLQQLATDLERAGAELTATQQKLAQEEARRNDVVLKIDRLREERTQLTEQVLGLRNQVVLLENQKIEMTKSLVKDATAPAKRKRKPRQPATE